MFRSRRTSSSVTEAHGNHMPLANLDYVTLNITVDEILTNCYKTNTYRMCLAHRSHKRGSRITAVFVYATLCYSNIVIIIYLYHAHDP